MRILLGMFTIAALSLCATAQETKAAARRLHVKDLPPAVQKTVESELHGAKVTSISKETEKGVAQYEIETILNGKHRDFNVDTKGNLLVVEEETTIDSIPAAARDTIMKHATGGKVTGVQLFKRGSEAMYEAAYTSKDGRKREILVKADGTIAKD